MTFVAPSNDPCNNRILAAANVTARQQIATAQRYIGNGIAAGNVASLLPGLGMFSNSVAKVGALVGYALAVGTGRPNDIKDQPGPGTYTQRVDAGNISFGITCPFGARFCQFSAGMAQTLRGRPNPEGTLMTGFDTPTDTAGIRQGQAMRAAGCHE